MHDCLALKHELGLPVLAQTRNAILELESDILAIKLKVLRSHHPDQLSLLDGMEDHSKEGKHEASRRGGHGVVTVYPVKPQPFS